MVEVTCGFNVACHVQGWLTSAVDGFLSIIPFGSHGLALIVGMIIGAILGKVGVGALLALAVALKLGSVVKVAHPDNPTQPTKRALTADEVRLLQHALNLRGFDAGPVDGKPGRQTREAIQQFQVSRDEIVTGIPTQAQLKALRVWK